jgi:hypothetical protein
MLGPGKWPSLERLAWQDHISATHRRSGAAISQLAVEGQDAAPMPCREGTKPVSIAATPVCRCEMPPSSPFSDRASTAPNGLFNGLIWPKVGCASIAYDATAASNFLPLPAAPPFLAGQESPP